MKTLCIKLTEEQYEQIREIAHIKRTSMAKLIREVMDISLNNIDSILESQKQYD